MSQSTPLNIALYKLSREKSKTFNFLAGNSNDGNCARKAFENYEIFARITEWPVNIVKGLHYMITSVNSTLPLDADEWETFANDWLDEFHESDLSWNWMSHTVHVLAHHGPALIRYFGGLIGPYSEEGPEANNKIMK